MTLSTPTANGKHAGDSTTEIMKSQHSKRWLEQLYFTYQLETTTYMLEPWEKFLFNSCVVAMTIGSGYVGYVCYSALANY